MTPVIVGSGLAGLITALHLSPRPVLLVSSGKLGENTSSAWAQGGLAAAVGNDDTPALHAIDTMNAGSGLCDISIVKEVTKDDQRVVADLVSNGVNFDRDEEGELRLGLEGAHSRRRIVHAKGDGTGKVILESLIKKVQSTPSIKVLEDTVAISLQSDERILGVWLRHNTEITHIMTDCVVLATGGCGALWGHTTNPLTSWGHGLALAARAGAKLADLEFMQFHPTAIECGQDPMPLASEALRGEGATLVDENGFRFMADSPRQELEPRDVVARSIWRHTGLGHRVFLDARNLGENLKVIFPSVYALCQKAKIDPIRDLIPVRPAAHYHMGGVSTDLFGRTSVEGLWACGEVASTGLHGANRLASNSLLEAASFGHRVAIDITNKQFKNMGVYEKTVVPVRLETEETTNIVRHIFDQYVNVVRDEKGLRHALEVLRPYALRSDYALSALLIATAALNRKESRGAHARSDFPQASSSWSHRQILTLQQTLNDNAGPFEWAIGATS